MRILAMPFIKKNSAKTMADLFLLPDCSFFANKKTRLGLRKVT